MKDLKELKELALHAVRHTTPAPTAEFSFTSADVEDTLRDEINAIAGDYNSYRKNKYDVFEIIQETADEVLPKKVLDLMGQFAEIRTFGNGKKVEFKLRKGRNRAKKFVTSATPAGVYEAFRLDSDIVTLNTSAIGGAAYIDFNRYLCGDEDIAESMSILLEGIEDAIYLEIQKALIGTIDGKTAPTTTTNVVVATAFSATNMQTLCNTVKAYGTGAVIFATPAFIASMGADVIVAPTTSGTPVVSQADIDSIHNTGLIQVFRGCPIVQLPQSFTDETNSETVLNDEYAYIFPTGGEKVVKIGFEGETIVNDFQNRDLSTEIQAFKKVGVAILHTNNWAIYRNTSL